LNPENSIAVSSDEEWVNALQRLVKNPSEYRAFGRAGRRFVERHHNLRDISKRLLDHLLAER